MLPRPMQSTMRFQLQYLLPTFMKIGSPRFRRFVVDFMPWKKGRKYRDIINVMDKTTVHIFNEKKRTLEAGDKPLMDQVKQAKDLMSILSKYHPILTSCLS